MGSKFKRFLEAGLLLCFICVIPAAAQSASTNYSANEFYFGVGGELDASSSTYRGQQSAGELGVGNAVSTTYQSQAGFNTTYQPFLEFNVTAASVDLGYLSTSTTATATGSFDVRAYLSSGYSIINASQPPTYGSHQLAPLTSGGISSPGTEQFGINLTDNASPNIGANPVQSPDTTFGFGTAAANYSIADTFRYNVNEVIASSTKSTGKTTFTVSYMYNISTTTPAGEYRFTHDIVCLPNY